MELPPLSAKTAEVIQLEREYSIPGYDAVPAVMARAKGVRLWDVDGKEYLDFTCMLGAVNQGHSHPAILEAVLNQLQAERNSTFIAALVNAAAHNNLWPAFAQMMCERFNYDKILHITSGTEAAESACKIARKWGIQIKGIPAQEALVLGVSGCFHGLSAAMWSLQDPSTKRDAYGISDPRHINYNPKTFEPLTYGDIAALKRCITEHHARIAAVVIECIRGHLRTFEQEIQFSANLYDLCKTHNILFIADEVRMGCGKTGRFLSCDYLGGSRRPDLLVLGKSISGGLYPAAFVLGRAECMDLVGTKEILSTYTFSPVALAATRAALKVIDDEGLVERARRIEKLFLEETGAWKHPIISHVTARGADFGIWLCGVEQRTCRQICEWCMHQGLLVFPNHLRIRMNVAMVITDEELLAGLQILKSVLDRTSRAE